MKKKEKIDKSLLAKLAVATVVPGGFIIWAAYEIGRAIEKKKTKGKDESK